MPNKIDTYKTPYKVRHHAVYGPAKITYHETLEQANTAADEVNVHFTGSEVEEFVNGIGWVLCIESEELVA